MSIITLTTDFGNKDYAVGAVKAALISDSHYKLLTLAMKLVPTT